MCPADDMSMRTPLSDQRKILPSARGNDFARALNSSQEARDLLPLHLGDLERDKNNLYANVEIKGRSRILPGDARNQHMFLSKQTISRTHKRLKGRFLIIARFVLFRIIKKRSFNLLCVLDLSYS